jgi:hypothetical protein
LTDLRAIPAEITFPLGFSLFCAMNKTCFFTFFAIDTSPGTYKEVPAEFNNLLIVTKETGSSDEMHGY